MCHKISVIVPVYNVEAYLNECVQSIVNQEYSNLDIILIDDGSTDSCPSICDNWAIQDERIRVIHKENGGLSDARNAGLDICEGDYIAFVDSDDWIRPEMYRIMLTALEKENADICACRYISCYPDRKVFWGAKNYKVGTTEEMLDLLYTDAQFPVCAWNKLYKKSLWEKFRFPVGKICEDAFTTYCLLHKADRIVQITDALYCYRIRPESIMTVAFSSKSMDEEEAWRKNYEFVKEYYPQLFGKAYTFYLQSVNVLIHKMDKEKRNLFRTEYEYLRKIMINNIAFMMFRSTAELKYRIRYLVDAVKLDF